MTNVRRKVQGVLNLIALGLTLSLAAADMLCTYYEVRPAAWAFTVGGIIIGMLIVPLPNER